MAIISPAGAERRRGEACRPTDGRASSPSANDRKRHRARRSNWRSGSLWTTTQERDDKGELAAEWSEAERRVRERVSIPNLGLFAQKC